MSTWMKNNITFSPLGSILLLEEWILSSLTLIWFLDRSRHCKGWICHWSPPNRFSMQRPSETNYNSKVNQNQELVYSSLCDWHHPSIYECTSPVGKSKLKKIVACNFECTWGLGPSSSHSGLKTQILESDRKNDEAIILSSWPVWSRSKKHRTWLEALLYGHK